MLCCEEVSGVHGLAGSFMALVSERAPSAATGRGGETVQVVKLLVPDGRRIDPPARLLVRGAEVRVLGTQAPPVPGGESLVTCERVNPDLPDDGSLVRAGAPVLDDGTGRLVVVETVLWSGPVHVASGVPSAVEAGGESGPLDKVTVTLPMSAPVANGDVLRVTLSRNPAVAAGDYRVEGEVLDSSSALRRVVAYRLGM